MRRVEGLPALGAILVSALLLRLALLPTSFAGGAGDVATFIGWTHLLLAYGTHGLYTHVEPYSRHVIDYPTGYPLVLTGIAHLYAPLAQGDHHEIVLRALLKLPAILADLGLCAVTFAVVRGWGSTRDALTAAAVAAFTPATWMISAVWGQIDSIPALFLLVAIALTLRGSATLGWVALGLSALVKPQAIVAAPLLLAWQVRREGPRASLVLGPVLAVALAYVSSLPFAPVTSPPAVLSWLFGRYEAGTGFYPYRSVSACNVYTLRGDFYGSDGQRVFGIPVWGWSMLALSALVVGITVITVRQLETKTDRALREKVLITACFIVLTAMFVLATRMHERYLFPAIALAPLVWFADPRQRPAVVILTLTFVGNCALQLFDVLSLRHHGVGTFVILFSVLNVAVLIALVSTFARPSSTRTTGRAVWSAVPAGGDDPPRSSPASSHARTQRRRPRCGRAV
jgi:dolichyl-phosphate-mannose-protein mannosyltransferase